MKRSRQLLAVFALLLVCAEVVFCSVLRSWTGIWTAILAANLAFWPDSVLSETRGCFHYCAAALTVLVYAGLAWLAYARRSMVLTLLFGVLVCSSAIIMWIKVDAFFAAFAAMKRGG